MATIKNGSAAGSGNNKIKKEEERSKLLTKLTWMPGMRPVKVPNKQPNSTGSKFMKSVIKK